MTEAMQLRRARTEIYGWKKISGADIRVPIYLGEFIVIIDAGVIPHEVRCFTTSGLVEILDIYIECNTEPL